MAETLTLTTAELVLAVREYLARSHPGLALSRIEWLFDGEPWATGPGVRVTAGTQRSADRGE